MGRTVVIPVSPPVLLAAVVLGLPFPVVVVVPPLVVIPLIVVVVVVVVRVPVVGVVVGALVVPDRDHLLLQDVLPLSRLLALVVVVVL